MSGIEESDFPSLGISAPLLKAIDSLHFTKPTPIQTQCIPPALQQRDIIALAPTGSGKTAAFAIPILQHLWNSPQGLFACILSPTRELAYQISAQCEALGAEMGVRCTVIVGGDIDRASQAIALAKKPHIIVATPGRLLDHLKSTKGFNLRSVKYLVMDEADRLLDLDFGAEMDELLRAFSQERTTYLFSATMTTKVDKIQRATLRDPLRVQVSAATDTVDTLLQYYILSPLQHKDAATVALVQDLIQNTMIIFTRTIQNTQRLCIILRLLGFSVIPLHGDLTQSQRLGALNKFKSGDKRILVATDVVSRGLDIPHVGVVLNYDMPTTSKDYIHRVGRTARAGRAGKAISMVTQYDVELLQRLETVIGKKFPEWPIDKEEIQKFRPTVDEASRQAVNELTKIAQLKKSGGKRRREDEGKYEGIEEVTKLQHYKQSMKRSKR